MFRFQKGPVGFPRCNPTGSQDIRYAFSYPLSPPCGSEELFVQSTKTVREHPMVLFIVVIVETFVHVQHKSNTRPLD